MKEIKFQWYKEQMQRHGEIKFQRKGNHGY